MSTEFYFPSRTSQQWLRVGPLAGDLDGFATRLKAHGYARPSAVSKLRLVSNLSRWLQHQGLDVEALDEPRIEAFLLTCGPRCVRRGEATTTRQLLSHLRASGRIALAPSSPENSNPFAQIERRYERFLVNERGLSRATVQNYLPIIHTFLAERFVTGAVALGHLVSPSFRASLCADVPPARFSIELRREDSECPRGVPQGVFVPVRHEYPVSRRSQAEAASVAGSAEGQQREERRRRGPRRHAP